MGMFFRTHKIYWSIRSKKDKRWNCDVTSYSCSCFNIPEELEKKIEEFTIKYGEKPDDLEYSCMKD